MNQDIHRRPARSVYQIICLAKLVRTVKDRLKSLVRDSRAERQLSRTDSIALLRHLDKSLDSSGPICKKAVKDSRFLHHGYDAIAKSTDLVLLRRTSRLSSLLLKRGQSLGDELKQRRVCESDLLGLSIDDVICEKFLANLEHLLLYLRQIALFALVYLCVRVATVETYSHLRDGSDWFSEWPSGHRPLSTTWPWNIRPSLLVLWGVCWMFYYGDTSPYGHDFRTRPNSWPSEPPTTQSNDALSSAAAVNPTVAWPPTLLSQQAGVGANNPSLHPIRTQQAYVAATPYIYVPSTSGGPVPWTYASQGPAAQPEFWQQVDNTGRQDLAVPASGDSSTQRFSWNLEFRGDMQEYYPPSPFSEPLEPSNSSIVASVAGTSKMSPLLQTVPSPSILESSGSPESRRRSLEPTRNPDGVLFCDFPECREGNPTFMRLCEWTKHIEKHTRPYICTDPNCDRIRGFTYSGGLQRHRREVHGQEGGPRAKFFCPHTNCPRNTLPGFTRRENLQEHLRRRHRDVNEEVKVKQEIKQESSLSALPESRKRRRRQDKAESEGSSSPELREQLKRLKEELRQKDERLQRLEAVVGTRQ